MMQQGRNSCPRLQFGFQFGLYRVVAPLSFPRSISLASLFTSYCITSLKVWTLLMASSHLYEINSHAKVFVSVFNSAQAGGVYSLKINNISKLFSRNKQYPTYPLSLIKKGHRHYR